MPALAPAPQTLKIRLVGTLAVTGPWNCIFHARYTGTAPTGADLLTVANTIATQYSASIAPLAHTGVVLTETHVIDLSSPTSPSAVGLAASTGTRTGTAFTAQVALVSSWTAQVRWRGGHFRNYWPIGVQADLANPRQWTQTFITAAQAGLDSFRTAINAIVLGGAPLTMVGLSRRTGHNFRPQPIPFTITGTLVHPRVDTQRRRLGKEHV